MNIKKFEQYDPSDEGMDDIDVESAKILISKWMDNDMNDVTLQEIYINLIEDHDLDKDQESMIQDSLITISDKIYKSAKEIVNHLEYTSGQYNL